MDGWILGRTSGIPRIFFCRGGRHHKEERAWDRDHRTHSLIFDYYYSGRGNVDNSDDSGSLLVNCNSYIGRE